MFKFSKKIEYALIAIKYMANKELQESSTTKEISDKHELSYELLAKVLQQLSKNKVLISFQGVKGGYFLKEGIGDIPLKHIIDYLNEDDRITKCARENEDGICYYLDICTVRGPLLKIQSDIDEILFRTKLKEIIY
ncbi:MAG: RrF2 family transcriptional regulator [Syntrophothermus sp.]|nr:Rrf2 family transcriptional regulator [Ignavibacteriaceae bacterium]